MKKEFHILSSDYHGRVRLEPGLAVPLCPVAAALGDYTPVGFARGRLVFMSFMFFMFFMVRTCPLWLKPHSPS
jgi:hypothetical protein